MDGDTTRGTKMHEIGKIRLKAASGIPRLQYRDDNNDASFLAVR